MGQATDLEVGGGMEEAGNEEWNMVGWASFDDVLLMQLVFTCCTCRMMFLVAQKLGCSGYLVWDSEVPIPQLSQVC